MPSRTEDYQRHSCCPLLRPLAAIHCALDRETACSGPSSPGCMPSGYPQACTDTAAADGAHRGQLRRARHCSGGTAFDSVVAAAASATPATPAVLQQHPRRSVTGAQQKWHIVAHHLPSQYAGLCGMLKSAMSAESSLRLALRTCPLHPDRRGRMTQRRWKDRERLRHTG